MCKGAQRCAKVCTIVHKGCARCVEVHNSVEGCADGTEGCTHSAEGCTHVCKQLPQATERWADGVGGMGACPVHPGVKVRKIMDACLF